MLLRVTLISPALFVTAFFVCVIQIPVDIVEGITDTQAREMAASLEFRGPSLEEVCYRAPAQYQYVHLNTDPL